MQKFANSFYGTPFLGVPTFKRPLFMDPPPSGGLYLGILQTSFEPSFSNNIQTQNQKQYKLFKNTQYLRLHGKHYIFIEFILKQWHRCKSLQTLFQKTPFMDPPSGPTFKRPLFMDPPSGVLPPDPPLFRHFTNIIWTQFFKWYSNSNQKQYKLFKNTQYLWLHGKHYIFIEFILKQWHRCKSLQTLFTGPPFYGPPLRGPTFMDPLFGGPTSGPTFI